MLYRVASVFQASQVKEAEVGDLLRAEVVEVEVGMAHRLAMEVVEEGLVTLPVLRSSVFC